MAQNAAANPDSRQDSRLARTAPGALQHRRQPRPGGSGRSLAAARPQAPASSGATRLKGWTRPRWRPTERHREEHLNAHGDGRGTFARLHACGQDWRRKAGAERRDRDGRQGASHRPHRKGKRKGNASESKRELARKMPGKAYPMQRQATHAPTSSDCVPAAPNAKQNLNARQTAKR